MCATLVVQTLERVKLLRSTLVTVWGIRDAPPGVSPMSSPPGSRSSRIRSSLEGLATLQGELDSMQRNFRSSRGTPSSPRSSRSEDAEAISLQQQLQQQQQLLAAGVGM